MSAASSSAASSKGVSGSSSPMRARSSDSRGGLKISSLMGRRPLSREPVAGVMVLGALLDPPVAGWWGGAAAPTSAGRRGRAAKTPVRSWTSPRGTPKTLPGSKGASAETVRADEAGPVLTATEAAEPVEVGAVTVDTVAAGPDKTGAAVLGAETTRAVAEVMVGGELESASKGELESASMLDSMAESGAGGASHAIGGCTSGGELSLLLLMSDGGT